MVSFYLSPLVVCLPAQNEAAFNPSFGAFFGSDILSPMVTHKRETKQTTSNQDDSNGNGNAAQLDCPVCTLRGFQNQNDLAEHIDSHFNPSTSTAASSSKLLSRLVCIFYHHGNFVKMIFAIFQIGWRRSIDIFNVFIFIHKFNFYGKQSQSKTQRLSISSRIRTS